MALGKCPECGNDVSTTAKACPKCGHNLSGGMASGCLWIGIAAVLLIVVGSALNVPKDKPMVDNESAAWACQEYVKKSLRDPDSAEFLSDPATNRASQLGDGSWENAVKVRAANGFGGKTVSIFTCNVEKGADGHWRGLHVKEW